MLVLGLERRADDACRCVVNDDGVRAVRREFLDHPIRGDVAADEDGLGASCADLLCCRLRGSVVAQVAEHDAAGSRGREMKRDRLADPSRPTRHEDGAGVGAHDRGGSGSYAGAELGTCSQPGRERGSRPPSSAFDDA